MQYPEPLSTMLREFDINSYLSTQQPIPISNLKIHIFPYIICKAHSEYSEHPKLIGYFTDVRQNKQNYLLLNKFELLLQFIITPTGELRRDSPYDFTDSYVYELPRNLINEMLYAINFNEELTNLVNTYRFVSIAQQKNLIKLIDNLIQAGRTDYLKMSLFLANTTPLIIASYYKLEIVMAKLLSQYTNDEINYVDGNGDYAEKFMTSKFKKPYLMAGLIRSMEMNNVELGDWDYTDISDSISGGAKKRRKTRKTKKYVKAPLTKSSSRYFL